MTTHKHSRLAAVRARVKRIWSGILREPPDGRHSYRRAFHEAAGEVTRPGNWLRLPAGVSPVSDAPQGVGSTSVPRASNAATTPTTCST
jgi:hypothetical protein